MILKSWSVLDPRTCPAQAYRMTVEFAPGAETLAFWQRHPDGTGSKMLENPNLAVLGTYIEIHLAHIVDRGCVCFAEEIAETAKKGLD